MHNTKGIFFLLGRWGCRTCGRSYLRKASRNRHERYECGKEKHFQCSLCPHACFLRFNLVKHLKTVHGVTSFWWTANPLFFGLCSHYFQHYIQIFKMLLLNIDVCKPRSFYCFLTLFSLYFNCSKTLLLFLCQSVPAL